MLADPGFGRYFTDRMFVARYRAGQGWYDARLTAYAPLQLDPATATLHYAQSIFEGLKAYAQPDGSVATFRPEANAARFARGAKRLAMPPVPEEAFLAAVDALVDADRDWVPTGADQTLYLRPVPDGQRAVPRRPAGARVPVPGHRQPGRRVLPARRAAGLGLPLRGLHPGGARRHRRRQVRRQLRRQPAGPGAGHRGRLRPGRLARRGREALRRGDGRDEPVLRPRLRRRRRAGHARAHRHAAARHHPRLADRRWPRELGHRVTERRFSRRRVARRACRRHRHRDLRLRHRGGHHARSAR